MFPDNTPKEREYYIAKAKGAVCIMQIGDMQMRDWPMPPPMVKGTSSWITAWWKGSCARSMHPADWEKIITREQRSLDTLEDVVRTVYKVLRKTEKYMSIHGGLQLAQQRLLVHPDAHAGQLQGDVQDRVVDDDVRVQGPVVIVRRTSKAHIGEVQCSLWPEEIMKEADERGVKLL